MDELREAIKYLNEVAAISRASFHQLPEIRCLLYIKKHLPDKLTELGISPDIDGILEELVLPRGNLESIEELDKEQFETLMQAFVAALANTVHLYRSAGLPINWNQLSI